MKSFDAVLCIIVTQLPTRQTLRVCGQRVSISIHVPFIPSPIRPVVLTNHLAARVCGAIVRRHLTIVAAQPADSPNATRVQSLRFRQSTLVTTRHPGPSKAAKRYTGNGFSVPPRVHNTLINPPND